MGSERGDRRRPPSPASDTGKTVILGIGNTLLGDEGAGVHAVRALRKSYPRLSGVEFLDGGTLSFTLAPVIEKAENLIVIDAMESHDEPGTVRLLVDEEMDRFLCANRKGSVHEVGLIDLLSIARLSDGLPARRALIGIQPGYVHWSDEPTPAVMQAIEHACTVALELIGKWKTCAN